jgi:methionyl-tRNA synthetase
MNKFFVSTPIYYVNDVPHIGHAYTTVAADTLARFWRQKLGPENVFSLTGTDEHGAKVAEAAKNNNQTPKEYADSVSPRFQEAWDLLTVNYDHFIRTTDPRHEKIASDVLQIIYEKGLIYEGVYEGLYCEGCEKFLTEADLVDGKCPLHPNREPVHQKEKNYFFKLSAFQEKLIDIFEKDEVKIRPLEKKNEVLGKLKLGLQDVSVSRAGVSWGIPVPWDTEQTIYVWVEALLNYYTATRFLEDKEKFWPADLHLIGKDILWFHTVIWNALLLASDIPLPEQIFAHGFFTINNQKMSKSLGNVISPQELVEKFGADPARYLLLSAFVFGDDGDFSFDKLTEKYNSDLANGLGNLVARTAKLAENSGFEFPEEDGHQEYLEFDQALNDINFSYASDLIKKAVTEANKVVDENRPWEQSGEDLKKTLTELIKRIRAIDYLIEPFMPQIAQKIRTQFKGPKIVSGSPLFPRIV